MLDRVDARHRRIARASLRDRVGGEPDPGLMGLLHRETNVVDAVDVALVVDDDLDQLGSVEDVFADGLAQLLTGVGVEILGRAEPRPFRVHRVATVARRVLPTEWRDDAARRDHRRPGHQALGDGAPQVDVGIVAGVAHIANGGKSRLEHRPGVGDPLDGPVTSGVAQVIGNLPAACHLARKAASAGNARADVRVAIDQPRHDGHPGEIDHGGSGRDRHLRADGPDGAPLDEDHLAGERRPALRVDQLARPDRRHLGAGAEARTEQQPEQNCPFHRVPSLFPPSASLLNSVQ